VGDYVRRVIVGVDGSMGSLQALRHAVTEARAHDAAVCAVLAWTPPGGEGADRRGPHANLRKVWKTVAEQRLRLAWDEALGGVPDDLPISLVTVRGWAGKALVELADSDGDLLVVGSGSRGRLRRLVTRSVGRYCLARARCQVLAVPASGLTRQLEHGLLPRALRQRMLTRELLAR
jgi:nucleotide-binding universal stress UspA family protein